MRLVPSHRRPWSAKLGVVAMLACLVGEARPADLPTRSAVASWLRHQERLVKSMACDYAYRRIGTSPAATRQINDLEARKPGQYLRYLVSDELAAKVSYQSTWRRSGEKERFDQTPLAPGSSAAEVMGFDGTVVRHVSRPAEGRPSASIHRPERSHFRVSVRESPFHILYEYVNRPFSEVVSRAAHYSAVEEPASGGGAVRIKINEESWDIELVIDGTRRLVAWSLHDKGRKSPRQAHTLDDYQSHPDPSGETIWFPRTATIRHLVPVPDDDHPEVAWATATMTFTNVRFNLDIPDETFVIDLPADAEVYDEVTGQGFLPASSALDLWTSPPSLAKPASVWPWYVACTIALLAFVVWYRYRRTAQAD